VTTGIIYRSNNDSTAAGASVRGAKTPLLNHGLFWICPGGDQLVKREGAQSLAFVIDSKGWLAQHSGYPHLGQAIQQTFETRNVFGFEFNQQAAIGLAKQSADRDFQRQVNSQSQPPAYAHLGSGNAQSAFGKVMAGNAPGPG
jgi:hypothetical protein